ncbi:MAG: hypothetical protein K6U80_17765 [Firmicutes bacterium]|nr:hypothetical protein [Bacillota bacterium]
MDWPIVLGLLSYIAIICCLTVWFTKNHYRKCRSWQENSGTEAPDKPDSPVPGSRRAGRD